MRPICVNPRFPPSSTTLHPSSFPSTLRTSFALSPTSAALGNPPQPYASVPQQVDLGLEHRVCEFGRRHGLGLDVEHLAHLRGER